MKISRIRRESEDFYSFELDGVYGFYMTTGTMTIIHYYAHAPEMVELPLVKIPRYISMPFFFKARHIKRLLSLTLLQ